MADRYLMGVDIGTYSSKGVLVSEAGEVVASRVVEHDLSMPRPGWAEHDPERVWWHDVLEICRALLGGGRVDGGRVAGVGVSTISPAVVPVGAEGRALRPAILYGIDTRATREIADLERLSGGRLDSQSAAPKVLWIRRNEPEVWSRTRRIVNGPGYLNLRLTGEATIDVYDAAIFPPLFDPRTLTWSEDFAETIAPAGLMPRVTWTCEICGRVTPQAARETGLAAGTPVITGTADAAAEAVSAGLVHNGDMMVMYGSSTFFIVKTPRPLEPRNFWSSHFLEPGTRVVAGGTAAAGSLTKWFRDQFGSGEVEAERAGGENAYAALARLADGSPPGARGLIVLPYFSGERTPLHDPAARGLIMGLTLRHTRADVYRAVLESVGYAIRHNIDALRDAGVTPVRILAVGGGTHNPLWMQIISDIAGITQHIPVQQIGASYGDAFLAGVGVGVFQSTAEAGRWVRTGAVVQPDPDRHRLYGDYYELYRELHSATVPIMHSLNALAIRYSR